MNNIQYINHNVIDTLEGVVAHGCNCQGVMGSGVAYAIRKKWHYAYQRYQEMCAAHREKHHPDMSALLGLSLIVNVGDDHLSRINSLFVANMFTQNYYGNDGKVYASVDAIRDALRSTMIFCRGAELPLYMPRIGCGLGGLSWDNDVGPIVDQLQRETDVQVYVCDLT
jgi:O-acetyl-ADP-ribose deacetylase (regulator of RNase III)